jgi:hypothetical protein
MMNGEQTTLDNLDSIYDAINASQVLNDKPTYAQLVAALRGCIFLCAKAPKYLIRRRTGYERVSSAELKKILRGMGDVTYTREITSTMDKILRKIEDSLILSTFGQETISILND